MVEALNHVRAEHGLAALSPSASLESSAARYASRLMRDDWFGHAPRIQASGRFHTLGEILAMHGGGQPRLRATVRGWLASPGHRSVILSGSFRWMGAGRALGRFGGARSTIWVVQFGR